MWSVVSGIEGLWAAGRSRGARGHRCPAKSYCSEADTGGRKPWPNSRVAGAQGQQGACGSWLPVAQSPHGPLCHVHWCVGHHAGQTGAGQQFGPSNAPLAFWMHGCMQLMWVHDCA